MNKTLVIFDTLNDLIYYIDPALIEETDEEYIAVIDEETESVHMHDAAEEVIYYVQKDLYEKEDHDE